MQHSFNFDNPVPPSISVLKADKWQAVWHTLKEDADLNIIVMPVAGLACLTSSMMAPLLSTKPLLIIGRSLSPGVAVRTPRLSYTYSSWRWCAQFALAFQSVNTITFCIPIRVLKTQKFAGSPIKSWPLWKNS